MQKDKVALFDFCETLVNFQTADAFVDYVREKMQSPRMLRKEKLQRLLRSLKLIQILEKITLGNFSINKRFKLWQLKGIETKELEILAYDYYQNRIKPNFIHKLVQKLNELKKEKFAIYLVSGGYDIYLKYFIEEYRLDGMISSRIKMKEGICTGRMNGKDCLRKNKILLLDKYFDEKPGYSIAFSDSITDLPFLLWVNKGYVISFNKHQIWINNYKLEEIIWDSERN